MISSKFCFILNYFIYRSPELQYKKIINKLLWPHINVHYITCK